VVVANADRRLEVFARDSNDGTIWHNAQMNPGGWSGFSALGPAAQGQPVPAITMVAPRLGSALGGTVVAITGTRASRPNRQSLLGCSRRPTSTWAAMVC
jgi:hypothetical protein